LGAEGLGADVDLRIGNGYTEGHTELALNLLRESPVLMRYFTENHS
jgi:L-erythro-3,5-diaminohexanoate dehydrogenase